MTIRFSELSVDCRDPRALATFWCEVLGYQVLDDREDQVEIGAWAATPAQLREGPQPPTLVFVTVPEGKSVKNRIHIDLRPVGRSHADEVERILALGATRADIGQGDVPWVVLADPEGNEFCVLGNLDEDS